MNIQSFKGYASLLLQGLQRAKPAERREGFDERNERDNFPLVARKHKGRFAHSTARLARSCSALVANPVF
jgi:hypothetical protein